MPYASDAQRRFMHAKHPGIAAKWDREYPHQKGLPEHVKGKKKHHKKAGVAPYFTVQPGMTDIIGQMAADLRYSAE